MTDQTPMPNRRYKSQTKSRPDQHAVRREFELLRSIDTQLIANAFNVNNVMAIIAESTQQLTGATHCTILMPREKNQLHVIWTTDTELKNRKIPLSQSLSGHSFNHCQPVLVEDVATHPLYFKAVQATRSELAVPLIDGFGAVI